MHSMHHAIVLTMHSMHHAIVVTMHSMHHVIALTMHSIHHAIVVTMHSLYHAGTSCARCGVSTHSRYYFLSLSTGNSTFPRSRVHPLLLLALPTLTRCFRRLLLHSLSLHHLAPQVQCQCVACGAHCMRLVLQYLHGEECVSTVREYSEIMMNCSAIHLSRVECVSTVCEYSV
jgi:hypothetical protein